METISGKNNRGIKIVVHYNRHTADKGLPWTVHAKQRCIQVSKVVFTNGVWTTYKPEKKSNPKGFLETKGKVEIKDNIAYIYA